MEWLDYREKLGVGFCDEEKANFLMTNLITYVSVVFSTVDVDRYISFILDTGSPISNPELAYNLSEIDTARGKEIINLLIRHSDTLNDFLSFLLPLINRANKEERSEHIAFTKKMLTHAHIPFDLIEDSDGYFIFPKGAKELDDALVSQPLEWLKEYPNTYKTFCIALRQYSEGVYIRDVADNLRKALESFLQEFLNNTKNLETNKNEICRYLGECGVDSGISGLFQPLINSYKNINDRIAKHNDAVDKTLLEFLLYQTGVLIRMVIVVNKEA